MILKTMIKRQADAFLEKFLALYPTQRKFLLDEIRYNKWIDLLHERLNQLDLEGYVPSKRAIDIFIIQAAGAYAKKQLEKVNLKLPSDAL